MWAIILIEFIIIIKVEKNNKCLDFYNKENQYKKPKSEY